MSARKGHKSRAFIETDGALGSDSKDLTSDIEPDRVVAVMLGREMVLIIAGRAFQDTPSGGWG